MNSRTQNILIAVLIVGLVSMTIAYAALTQVLNINAGAKVLNKSSSWNIHFTQIESGNAIVLNPTGYQTVASNTITLTNTTATLPVVSLRAPGDYAEFYFDVINEGEITGYINVIDDITIPDGTASGMTSQQIAAIKNAISATLTDTQGNALQVNSALAKNARLHLKVRIELSSSLEELPPSEVTFSGITASITYGQNQVSQGGGGNEQQGGNEPSYTYVAPGVSETGTLDNSWDIYIRKTGTTEEVCKVFSSGTVCISPDAYNEDLMNCSGWVTYTGSGSACLTGSARSKADEMLSKGATSCEASYDNISCTNSSGGECYIGNGGDAVCYDSSSYNSCIVNDYDSSCTNW